MRDTYYYVIDRNYAYDFEKEKLPIDAYSILKSGLKGDYKISKLKVDNYDKFKTYFYKTDHHWNLNGSYQGYKDIIKMIYPNDKILVPKKIKTVTNSKFTGSASKTSKFISLNETFKYYYFDLPKHYEYIDGFLEDYGNYEDPESEIKNYKNIYAIVYGGDEKEIIFDYNNSEKENLLLIASSYSNPINRLVASHFNNTYVVDFRHYEDFNIESYVESHDIDKILVLASTDILIDEDFNIGEG